MGSILRGAAGVLALLTVACAAASGGGAADDDDDDAPPPGTPDAATTMPPDDADAALPPPSCSGESPPRPAELPDFSHAGYRGGALLPDATKILVTIDATAEHGVIADDGLDDSAALQAAIAHAGSIAGRDFDHFVVVQLPAGRLDLSQEIHVDQSFVILRGRGSDSGAAGSTRIVVRPGVAMRWDVLSADGSQPGLDDITQGSASGGWLWPGRGAFRVQTRAVHSAYAAEYASAPANRKDLFEGTVNAHWKAGLKVAQDVPYAAHAGDTTIRLAATTGLVVGRPVWVGATNSARLYQDQGVADTSYWVNGHMRAQVFTVVAVDASAKTVTLDKALEFDLPASSTSDGSAAIEGTDYFSKVVPLTVVEGVGFEDFELSYDLDGLPRLAGGGTYQLTRAMAKDEYGNLAPEYALHGIIFKWATDSWVRHVRLDMVGSHPIVTEVARHLQIEDNVFSGSWNKGKGGNGYLRGSRVWDSLYRGNVLRELRHFTFQWSASGNVATGNDLDCDFNLHGGWERGNLIENNVVHVSYDHRPGRCTVNCGEEGGGTADSGTWWPLWWGAGAKAGKWSGASGPRNLLFANTMTKQLEPGGPYVSYAPYDASAGACPYRIFQVAWSREGGGGYQPLATDVGPISDWAGHETVDFSVAPALGVDGDETYAGASLWK
jgi:hypothetical protein